MDLGKFIFGQGYNEAIRPYRETYEGAKQDLYDVYANAFDDSQFYEKNKDLFKEAEKENPGITQQFLSGTYGKGLAESGKAAQSAVDEAYNALGKAKRENKYNVVGNGLLGTLLSPFFGVADVAGDMFEQGGKSIGNLVSGMTSGDWNKYDVSNRYNRTDSEGFKTNDFAQDLGSIGNAVLSAADVGNLGSAASLGTKALRGAALGGTQNMLYNLQQNGEYANLGDILSDVAYGAGFGAGIPVLGAVGSKLGSAVANKGVDAIANQAVQQGYAPELARQIAQNTSKASQAAAGLGQVMRSKPFKIGAGAVAGGTLLSNLMGNQNANQTGYNDDATYGSDLYGTTQGYNYGTYGY